MLGDRTITLYILIFALLGTGGILFFWVMGALLLLTDNGGQITELGLAGATRTLFLSYPFVAVVATVAGWLAYLGRRDLVAVGLAGLPVAATVVFYLWLVVLR